MGLVLAGCGGPVARAVTAYTVSFDQAAHVATEGGRQPSVTIRLSSVNSSGADITVQVVALARNDENPTGRADDSRRLGLAHGHDYGSGQDFNLTAAWPTPASAPVVRSEAITLTFPAKSQELTLPISIIDDRRIETSEVFQLELSNPRGASLGAVARTRILIEDNDARTVKEVSQYRAVGDGTTDDTAAIQQTVDATFAAGGGVVLFSPGRSYLVRSINLKPGVTYQGYGATLRQVPTAGNFVDIFNFNYSGKTDSAPVVIKGLTFDGNKQRNSGFRYLAPDNRGSFFEHSHSINIHTPVNAAMPGRGVAYVEEVSLLNALSDGISSVTNAWVRIFDVYGENSNRGFIDMNGGNNTSSVRKAWSKNDFVHVEVDVPGTGDDAWAGQHWVEDVDTQSLFVNYGYAPNRKMVRMQRVRSTLSTVIIGSGPAGAHVLIEDSDLAFGAMDTFSNRVLWNGSLTVRNSTIRIVRGGTSKGDGFGMDLWMDHMNHPRKYAGQALRLIGNEFISGTDFVEGDKRFGLYFRAPSSVRGVGPDNSLCLSGNTFDPTLTDDIRFGYLEADTNGGDIDTDESFRPACDVPAALATPYTPLAPPLASLFVAPLGAARTTAAPLRGASVTTRPSLTKAPATTRPTATTRRTQTPATVRAAPKAPSTAHAASKSSSAAPDASSSNGCSRIQAEDAMLGGYVSESYSVGPDRDFAGFEGSGYAGGGGRGIAPGARLQWVIDTATSGNVVLKFRYLNGYVERTTAALSVGGAAQQTITLSGTLGWSGWKTEAVSVPLAAGSQPISLEHRIGDVGAAVYDWFEVCGASIRPSR